MSDVAKRIREIIEKAAASSTFTAVITGKCHACGQKNRWEAGRAAKCGKCGFPLKDPRVLH